ncbi:MAG TPA: protease pro-enzyme activation domain-containing protein, partial [Burkholderiaceae bacterium]|nr:protease pro-enzyme activation domain-containing protein [Burkholderiaceae bacterium]
MPSHFRLKLLAAAIGIAAATSVCAASTNNASAFVALTSQHATTLHRGDVAAGPLAFSQPMQIVVSLKLRNQSQLNSFLAKAQQPGTPTAQRTMSPEEFAAQFSP